ncbi:hypothetical protein F2Q69_00028636 [Brassica cretica]|uniref:Uncharacterized protein n=1 Tax=Brassica cretica TaxID=69181 RepID=A0A8S9S2Q6_BRACR|nr:hypothetical protein F2Q69_00028636 [Brassica cretica]
MDASCLRRFGVWSWMCAEDVGRDLIWNGRVFFLSSSRAAEQDCELAVIRTWAGSVVDRELRMSRIRNA